MKCRKDKRLTGNWQYTRGIHPPDTRRGQVREQVVVRREYRRLRLLDVQLRVWRVVHRGKLPPRRYRKADRGVPRIFHA